MLYLGAVISCDGKNSKNILHKQNRALGTQITKYINGEGVRKIYIGISFHIPKLTFKGKHLYAAEAMINISEQDFRKIEQIEEDLMRKLFSTDRSCPIHFI